MLTGPKLKSSQIFYPNYFQTDFFYGCLFIYVVRQDLYGIANVRLRQRESGSMWLRQRGSGSATLVIRAGAPCTVFKIAFQTLSYHYDFVLSKFSLKLQHLFYFIFYLS